MITNVNLKEGKPAKSSGDGVIYEKALNPDMFKGVKLPIIFMEENCLPVPVLCPPLKPYSRADTVDILPESLCNFGNSAL